MSFWLSTEIEFWSRFLRYNIHAAEISEVRLGIQLQWVFLNGALHRIKDRQEKGVS